MLSLRARFILSCFLGAGLLMVVLPRQASSQVLYGSIVGNVTDQSGAAVPGAKVTVTNQTTGLQRQDTTNAAGAYRILDLPEGTYRVDVSMSGFKPLSKTDVPVVIGQVNEEDLQLQVGTTTQEVTVQGTAAVLQTQKADVHTTISSYAIENLPLNVYHNFQTTELLAPGVYSISGIRNSYPNSIADTPERSFAINSNGLPQHINTTRVDGATNLFIWLPDHMLLIPPEETIQEVNVQTADYDVEKGLTAGVATDVVTKSGTNQFHGSLYGFHTNQALDARNLFDHTPRAPKNIQNNDGVEVGGPIKHDKLFFFGNWDGTWQRTNESYFDLIPPTDYRAGDFSSQLGSPLFSCSQMDASGNCIGAYNPINVCTTEGTTVPLQEGMVFDPASGNPADGTGRCVFSSGGKLNLIPGNRMNQGALNFWQLLPAPNVPGAFTSNTAENYFVSKTLQFTRNIYTAKIDWDQSDRHTIWWKYSAQIANTFEPFDFPEAGGGGTGPAHQFATLTTLGHSWTLSPSLVLTGHLGFDRMSENAHPPGFGKPLGQSVLGIAGANEPTNDIRYSGLPGIEIGPFDSLGSATSWEPVTRNDWTLTTSHNLSWVKGNHEIRTGIDAAHNHLNHFQPEIVCCPRGNLYFFGDNTFLDLPANAAQPDSANQLPVFLQGQAAPVGFASDSAGQNSTALFDLGYLSEVQKSEQFIKSTAKDWQFGLYLGDRWRVTPKLTADLGLRWEYYPLITRDGVDKFEQYNELNDVLSLGGVGGNPTHLGVTTSKKLFAPRLGLAYRITDKTVIRSGFGLSNDTLPLERPLRGFYPLAIGADDFVPSSPVSTYQPFDTFAQGVPLIQNPDISTGKVTPPPDVIVGTMAPGHFNRGYVISWNGFVQRQLPSQILLSVGYVGNHYVHEFNGRRLQTGTLGGGEASVPIFSQFGRTGETYLFGGYLDSHYNSLQVELTRHVSTGLFLQGSYTYSKVIGYVNDTGWENGLRFTCLPSPALPNGCQALNRQTLSFDHTHMVKMAFVYQLPFGAGKRLSSSNRVANAIIGGWQVNGVFTGLDGAPLTLSGPNRLRTPGMSQGPDQIAAAKYPKGQGPGQFWFSPSSFAPVETLRVGTVGPGLSWLRGPGIVQLDSSLFRHFKLFQERADLQFRLEALNTTNSPHFNNPSGSCRDVNGVCGGSMGQTRSTFGQRIVQLGVVIRF